MSEPWMRIFLPDNVRINTDLYVSTKKYQIPVLRTASVMPGGLWLV